MAAYQDNAPADDPRLTNKLGGKNKPKKDLKTFLSKLRELIIEFE